MQQKKLSFGLAYEFFCARACRNTTQKINTFIIYVPFFSTKNRSKMSMMKENLS